MMEELPNNDRHSISDGLPSAMMRNKVLDAADDALSCVGSLGVAGGEERERGARVRELGGRHVSLQLIGPSPDISQLFSREEVGQQKDAIVSVEAQLVICQEIFPCFRRCHLFFHFLFLSNFCCLVKKKRER